MYYLLLTFFGSLSPGIPTPVGHLGRNKYPCSIQTNVAGRHSSGSLGAGKFGPGQREPRDHADEHGHHQPYYVFDSSIFETDHLKKSVRKEKWAGITMLGA